MNNIKLILRGIWKKRFTNSINLLSIVIGLTVSALILIYVKNEYSANKFLPDFNRIYRLETNWGSFTSYKQMKLFREEIAEIEDLTSYQFSWSMTDLIQLNNVNYEIEDAVYADSSFFRVFQFKALHGDLASALNNKNSLVITKSEALRIFKNTNCVNEIISFNASNFGVKNYTITAVIDDFPENSSIHFQVLLTLSSLLADANYGQNADHWGTCNYSSFVKLAANSNAADVQEKMNASVKEHTPDWVHDKIPIYLNPLKSLNFNTPEFDADGVFKTSNKSSVLILAAIGLLILLLAGINYFNLNIAQIESNLKDIGIRKTVGASNFNIGVQSMLSTFILFSLAVFFSIMAISFILPVFNEFTNSSMGFELLFSGSNFGYLILIVLLSCFLFGLFPALVAIKQKPIYVLAKKGSSSSSWVKNSLMVFQFFIAIILIASTLMLNKQNHFLLNTNYGYNRENILYVPLSPEAQEKHKVLEEAYEKESIIEEVAFGSGLFGEIGSNWGRNLYCDGKEIDVEFDFLTVSSDFFRLFGLEIILGNEFNEYSPQQHDMIYNEAFVNKYHIDKPLNTFLSQNEPQSKTVGVVKDFNHGSLRNKITPIGFMCVEEGADILFLKFNTSSPAQMQNAFSSMEEIWNDVSPNFPFKVHFLDKHMEEVYESEIKMMKVLSVASILSILIAVLGLFCISYFIINKRINEIGIRKVNGASIIEVLQLLNLDIVQWVIVAITFAIPTAYLILNRWLEKFAYKTDLSWWVFALAGLLALSIALITVTLQSWRVATKNPVESLRYE